MRAIILAAGMGLRLNPLTNNLPKCLIEVNGKSILENALTNLEKNKIEETVIVVGYLKDKIINKIGSRFGKMKITYIENKIYDKTNNVYSLWLAREYLKEGCILIEGDVLFEERILSTLLNMDKSKSYWVVDKFSREMDGCMITININTSQIKNIQIVRDKYKIIKTNSFKSIGIIKITSDLAILFINWLNDYIKKTVDSYYDLVFAEHVNEYPIYGYNVINLRWVEIDDIFDLKKAFSIFGELV